MIALKDSPMDYTLNEITEICAEELNRNNACERCRFYQNTEHYTGCMMQNMVVYSQKDPEVLQPWLWAIFDKEEKEKGEENNEL